MKKTNQVLVRRSYLFAGLWTLFTYLITAVHHYYTGVYYETMWRAEFAIYAIIPTFICLTTLTIHYNRGGRLLLFTFALVSFIFFFLVVGVWEGAWCHATKLVCYFLNIPFHNAPAAWHIPPAPAPEDLFSELTGVLNFVFATFNLHFMIKLLKALSIQPQQTVTGTPSPKGAL